MLLEFRDSTIQFELNGIIVSMIGIRFDAVWFALTSEISGRLKKNCPRKKYFDFL